MWLSSNEVLRFKSTKRRLKGKARAVLGEVGKARLSWSSIPWGTGSPSYQPLGELLGGSRELVPFLLQHLIPSLGPVLFNDAELPSPLKLSLGSAFSGFHRCVQDSTMLAAVKAAGGDLEHEQGGAPLSGQQRPRGSLDAAPQEAAPSLTHPKAVAS